METRIDGHNEEKIGVSVWDENDSRHTIEVGFDGDIIFHGNDDYPRKVEERTDEQQRIMSQVEIRAQYAAQREFEDADILDPMWDIKHLEAGLEALAQYPLDRFYEDFRDFYDALDDPGAFITDEFDLGDVVVYKFYRFESGEITDVAPVLVRHFTSNTTADNYGSQPGYPHEQRIACTLPAMDFDADYEFEKQFHGLVTGHLLAAIRDLYLHMGEAPPEKYQVDGIGKFDIHGDGIGAV